MELTTKNKIIVASRTKEKDLPLVKVPEYSEKKIKVNIVNVEGEISWMRKLHKKMWKNI
jgi:hypothetical protein